jgi:hypothetical protein
VTVKLFTELGDSEIQCRYCGHVCVDPDYNAANTWMENHECLDDDKKAWLHTREVLAHAQERRNDYGDEEAKLTAFTTDVAELTGSYDMSLADMIIALGNTTAGVGRYLAEFDGSPDFPGLNVAPTVHKG